VRKSGAVHSRHCHKIYPVLACLTMRGEEYTPGRYPYAKLRHDRIRATEQQIVKSLQDSWRGSCGAAHNDPPAVPPTHIEAGARCGWRASAQGRSPVWEDDSATAHAIKEREGARIPRCD